MRLSNLVGLSLCTFILGGCAVVDPGNRGVMISLGKMNNNLLQPGMFTYNPLFDSVRHYTVRQKTVNGTCNPLTSDQQPITVTYKVMYRLPENRIIDIASKYVGDPYDSLVDPQVQESFRQVVSQYKADQATRNLSLIKDQVLAMVKNNVGDVVYIQDIPVTHVDLPQTLQAAIADKQIMEQTALKKQYELDKAKKEAEINVVNGQAEAQVAIAKAKAQAESIRVQREALQQSPQLIEYERVKALQKWDGKLPEIIGGGNGGGFMTMLNLGTKGETK